MECILHLFCSSRAWSSTILFYTIQFICTVGVDSSLRPVYLNSYKFCGHSITHKVSPKVGYEILPDISPKTKTKTFIDCETTFHSEREKGNLCLRQPKKFMSITDRNVNLKAFDGVGNPGDTPIFHLVYHPSNWKQKEYCTTSPYITMNLIRVNKGDSANITNVHVYLQVVDIESQERKFYLDEKYCNGEYTLKNSMVSIFNRLPQDSYDTAYGLSTLCGLYFERDEKNESRRICLVYMPSDHVECKSQWTFEVSAAKFDPDEKHRVYKLGCNDTQAKTLHVWCANNQTQSVTLIFRRGVKAWSNSSEPYNMFRIILADYAGSEESLMDKVVADFSRKPEEEEEQSQSQPWVIILIVLAVLVVIVSPLAVVLYRKRSQVYRAVVNREL